MQSPTLAPKVRWAIAEIARHCISGADAEEGLEMGPSDHSCVIDLTMMPSDAASMILQTLEMLEKRAAEIKSRSSKATATAALTTSTSQTSSQAARMPTPGLDAVAAAAEAVFKSDGQRARLPVENYGDGRRTNVAVGPHQVLATAPVTTHMARQAPASVIGPGQWKRTVASEAGAPALGSSTIDAGMDVPSLPNMTPGLERAMDSNTTVARWQRTLSTESGEPDLAWSKSFSTESGGSIADAALASSASTSFTLEHSAAQSADYASGSVESVPHFHVPKIAAGSVDRAAGMKPSGASEIAAHVALPAGDDHDDDSESHGRAAPKLDHCCAKCDRAFRSKSDLIAHIRTHTGEKPLRCRASASCTKRFAHASNRAAHERTHRNEKRYICDWKEETTGEVCGKRFAHPSSLKDHTYKHMGIRPYSCNIPGCTATFTGYSNLTRHKKKLHGIGAAGRKRKGATAAVAARRASIMVVASKRSASDCSDSDVPSAKRTAR